MMPGYGRAMKIEDQERFPAANGTLRDGRTVMVRPLRVEDGGALAAFYASVPAGDIRFYCPYPLTRERAYRNAAEANDPRRVVLVMESAEGDILGYAWTRWQAPDAGYSRLGICVARSVQGQGAGRILMDRLLTVAGKIGPPAVRLTVQRANRKAVALYRSLGFRILHKQMRPANPSLGLEPEPEYLMERETGIPSDQ